jgi:hypothetical protein
MRTPALIAQARCTTSVVSCERERGHPGDASLGKDTNAISVLVRDDGTDDQFELSVEPADALHTFEHPYAYAAWRGVDHRLADLRDAA